LNCALSSDVPDTVRLEPTGTASPFEGDTIFTNALAYRMSPGLLIVRNNTRTVMPTAFLAVFIFNPL
jgi:hypothetical protein